MLFLTATTKFHISKPNQLLYFSKEKGVSPAFSRILNILADLSGFYLLILSGCIAGCGSLYAAPCCDS